MGIVSRDGSTVPSACRNSHRQTSRIAADLHPILPGLGYAAALAVGLSALLFVPPDRNIEEVAQLERLAPKSNVCELFPRKPERASIDWLLDRALLAGTTGQSHEMRRKAAIDRVTNAMRAKEDISTGRSIADAVIQ